MEKFLTFSQIIFANCKQVSSGRRAKIRIVIIYFHDVFKFLLHFGRGIFKHYGRNLLQLSFHSVRPYSRSEYEGAADGSRADRSETDREIERVANVIFLIDKVSAGCWPEVACVVEPLC